MSWTDERVSALKRMWADGCSAGRIAIELGGVTRNAVIGKVQRLGLERRSTRITRPPGRPRTTTLRVPAPRLRPAARSLAAVQTREVVSAPVAPEPPPVAPKVVPPVEPEESSSRCSLMDLKRDSCRWPIGDPGEAGFGFCGGKAVDGLPYCAHHASIAYTGTGRAVTPPR